MLLVLVCLVTASSNEFVPLVAAKVPNLMSRLVLQAEAALLRVLVERVLHTGLRLT